jgi:hypothetical protein
MARNASCGWAMFVPFSLCRLELTSRQGRSHYDYSDDRAPYMRAVSNPERPVEARDPNKLCASLDVLSAS